jgi:hypothetical protein
LSSLRGNVPLLDETCLKGWPEKFEDLSILKARECPEGGYVEGVSDARSCGEDVEGIGIELLDLGDEHVEQRAKVEIEGLDLVPVELPLLFFKREAEDVLINKTHDELLDEEGVSICLLLDDLGEFGCAFRVCVEHVGDHEVDALAGQGTELDLAGSVEVTEAFSHQVEFRVGFVVAH